MKIDRPACCTNQIKNNVSQVLWLSKEPQWSLSWLQSRWCGVAKVVTTAREVVAEVVQIAAAEVALPRKVAPARKVTLAETISLKIQVHTY